MSGLHLSPSGAVARFHAPHADLVEVCLFDDGVERRIALEPRDDGSHTASLEGVAAGQKYGLRVHGPWQPDRGLWHHPDLLLVDPFGRAMSGRFLDHPAVHHGGPRGDTAPYVPRSVLVDPPSPPRPGPAVPWPETVVYETHVRSLTMRHPGVPAGFRGTYLGAASSAVIDHLLDMGVTTVELMPVAHHVTEPFLQERGLQNHWGYSSLGWFAPHAGYATADDGRQVREFAEMVDRFHAAGLEVIVDAVFNHTAEGGLEGPILSFKGLDNPGWYRLDDEGGYVDWTGTGNTLDAGKPRVRQSVLEALHWWANDLGVDGFRFDLAVTLGRGEDAFDPSHLSWLTEDPVLSTRKLIAEPWDLGPHGYRLGHFGGEWREWNGRFRDDVRDFWRGKGTGHIFALRVRGSPDVFGPRSPGASINLVTSHDGFTLADVVSYDHKHNEANRESNHDGHDDNRSWNSGHEGPTDDPVILEVRRRRSRALLATTFLAAGTPMLLGGDELGNSHDGNNNAYPLDELNWYDWRATPHVDLIRALTALRRGHPCLGGGEGEVVEDAAVTVIATSLGDDRALIAANPGPATAACALPGGDWVAAFDSTGMVAPQASHHLEVPAWTVVVLVPATDLPPDL